jgi:hypothetical protein
MSREKRMEGTHHSIHNLQSGIHNRERSLAGHSTASGASDLHVTPVMAHPFLVSAVSAVYNTGDFPDDAMKNSSA